MSRAKFGFAAHPEALADLRTVPERIRDLALLELQHLVHGNERGAPLHGSLSGCHKVYIDPAAEWRLVVQFRDAPSSSLHRREIYLLAAGPRQDSAVYRNATARLHGQQPIPATASASPRVQAALSRSPQARPQPSSIDRQTPMRSAPAAVAAPTTRKVPS